MKVLVASASTRRQTWYCEQLEQEGIQVASACSGMDCISRMRDFIPDVLVLETSLMWGGSDGVLAVRAADGVFSDIQVVLVAAEGVTPEIYDLSRFSVQSFFSGIPPSSQLMATLRALAGTR